jgi:hypothetical protein
MHVCTYTWTQQCDQKVHVKTAKNGPKITQNWPTYTNFFRQKNRQLALLCTYNDLPFLEVSKYLDYNNLGQKISHIENHCLLWSH